MYLQKSENRCILFVNDKKTSKKRVKSMKIINKCLDKGIFSILIGISAYSMARLIKHSPSLPKITDIVKSAAHEMMKPSFIECYAYTLKIVLTGIAISFVIGFAIALACSMSSTMHKLIMPIVNSTKNVPSVALFPLFIVLMGIGDMPRIFVIIWNSIYPVISSTMAGFDSVDDDIINAAKNAGANKSQIFFRIKIPLAMISVMEGIKIACGSGFIAIVVAEMLGATKGIGFMILWSANAFKYAEMYFYILVVAFTGLVVNVAIEALIIKMKKEIYYDEKKVRYGISRSDGNSFTRRVRGFFCRTREEG